MENPAIITLRRELENEQARVSSLTAQIGDAKANIAAYESAIAQLQNERAVVVPAAEPATPLRTSTPGERVIDLVFAEIQNANGISTAAITENLTNGGRPTDRKTVSSLVSKLRKQGKVKRHDNGLFYEDEFHGL